MHLIVHIFICIHTQSSRKSIQALKVRKYQCHIYTYSLSWILFSFLQFLSDNLPTSFLFKNCFTSKSRSYCFFFCSHMVTDPETWVEEKHESQGKVNPLSLYHLQYSLKIRIWGRARSSKRSFFQPVHLGYRRPGGGREAILSKLHPRKKLITKHRLDW